MGPRRGRLTWVTQSQRAHQSTYLDKMIWMCPALSCQKIVLGWQYLFCWIAFSKIPPGPLEHFALVQSIFLGMTRDICICSNNFLATRNALRNHFSWLWSSFFITQYRTGSWGRMTPNVLEAFVVCLIFSGKSPKKVSAYLHWKIVFIKLLGSPMLMKPRLYLIPSESLPV